MLDEADEKGLGDKADDILLTYLASVDAVKDLSGKQMQTIQSIHDDLKVLLD